MNKNGKNINGKAMIAAFLTPNVFISVCVPVFLSASLSTISFVIDPPIKNDIAIRPIAIGNGSNALPKTLHDARIPNSPLGIPTQSWLRYKTSLSLGGIE